MKEVTNLHTQPVTLAGGTVLAAAGTNGATKAVSDLSERDERLVRRGLIVVREPEFQAAEAPSKVVVAQSPKPKAQSPEAQVKES